MKWQEKIIKEEYEGTETGTERTRGREEIKGQ